MLAFLNTRYVSLVSIEQPGAFVKMCTAQIWLHVSGMRYVILTE